MGHLRLWFDNTSFDSAALTGTTTQVGFPITNVQDQARTVRARIDSVSHAKIYVDFGQESYASGLALINHNLTYDASITVSAGTTPGGNDLMEETFAAEVPVIGFGEGGFGDYGFGGYLSSAEMEELVVDRCRGVVFASPVEARYWTIDLHDPDNTDGYLAIGRIFLCEAVESPQMPAGGFSITPQDDSNERFQRSIGGQKHGDIGLRYRVMSLSLSNLDPTVVWWTFFKMLRKVGTFYDMVIDVQASESEEQDMWGGCLYGKISSSVPVTLNEVLYGTINSIEIEESL